MADRDKVYRLLPQIVSVPSGITNAVFVAPVAGQVSVDVKLVSGGTLFVLPANDGSTYAAATLAALWATFAYQVGAVDTVGGMVVIDGPASFYLGSNGGVSTVHLLRKKSDGQ